MQVKPPPYLTTLTPLRGIAALIVVVFHCNIMFIPFIPQGYTRFLDNGWLWVDFFFVLSGFIMCYAYGKYFSGGVKWDAYKRYAGARFARVYPLHFITTIWAFVSVVLILKSATHLDPFFAEVLNPKALPACLLLIQSLHLFFTPPLNSPSWSLSTEWWIYMIFPFMVTYFTHLKGVWKPVMVLFIVGFYVFLRYVIGPQTYFHPGFEHAVPKSAMGPLTYFHPGPTLNILTDFGLFRCLAGFITGMLTFTFYQHRSGYKFFSRDWFFILCLFGMLAAMHFGIIDLLIVAFFPVIILSAAYNITTIKRILNFRLLQRLGDWSFSIYMVHVPIIWTFTIFAFKKNRFVTADYKVLLADFKAFTGQQPNYIFGLVMCVLIVVITLVISALTYRFIEIPARNYFNKVFKTKRRKISAESVEV